MTHAGRVTFFLAEVLAFTLLLQAAFPVLGTLLGHSFPAQLGIWLLYGFVALVLGWILNRFQRKQGLRGLGFRYYRSFWGDVWAGTLGYAVLYLVSLPLDLVALPDRVKMTGQMLQQLSLTSLPQVVIAGSLIALVIGFVTGVFHEEIRFRGYYQGAGGVELTPLAGFIIAVIPFTFGHGFSNRDWSIAQVAATVIPGVVFGLLYNATRSLVVVMTTHALTNWIGSYPVLLTVGTKSRTAGLVTAGVLAVLFLALVFARRKREFREWTEATGKMFRHAPLFGLLAGGLIGLLLLLVWAYRLPAAHAGIAGALLFGISVLGKRLAPVRLSST